jgi:hypothetical protein
MSDFLINIIIILIVFAPILYLIYLILCLLGIGVGNIKFNIKYGKNKDGLSRYVEAIQEYSMSRKEVATELHNMKDIVEAKCENNSDDLQKEIIGFSDEKFTCETDRNIANLTIDKIATKTSWKNYPIDKPTRLEIDLHFTDQQFIKLFKGHIPETTNDNWFVYFDGDCLYFHKSAIGFGIYKAQVIKESKGYSIKEFWSERNRNKWWIGYNGHDDSLDIETFTSEIKSKYS